jgi:hypothetical protein
MLAPPGKAAFRKHEANLESLAALKKSIGGSCPGQLEKCGRIRWLERGAEARRLWAGCG